MFSRFILIRSFTNFEGMTPYLTVDKVCCISADVKLRNWKPIRVFVALIKLAPDGFNDQIEKNDNNEVKHDESVHLLAKFCLWTLIKYDIFCHLWGFVDPIYSDH